MSRRLGLAVWCLTTALALGATAGCGSGPSANGDGGAGTGSGGGGSEGGAAGTGGAGSGGGAAGTGGAAGGHAGTGGAAGGHAGEGGSAGGGFQECPGTTLPSQGQPCRTSTDCPGPFGRCGPDYLPSGCGAFLPGPHECSGDGGCAADQLCLPSPMVACTGPGLLCKPRCTSTSCGASDTCDTASGLCKPTPCTAGFTCASGLICAPQRSDADAHGCSWALCATDGYTCPAGYACGPGQNQTPNGCSEVSCVGGGFKCPLNTTCDATSTSPHHCQRKTCTSDKNCDCGACIQGTCRDRLFVCSPPPAA